MAKLLFIFGTRPEAIKLAPVILLAKSVEGFEVKVLVTAQHRKMLDQVLNFFEIVPDFDLNLMKENQDLTDITTRVLEGCRNILKEYCPDLVLVHGDTTTTFAASLASFYQKIKVAHVEAGLRTYNYLSPFPEEMNRALTSKLASYHFSPTIQNAQNLKKENISSNDIIVTGNTVIDALNLAILRINSSVAVKKSAIDLLNEKIKSFGNKEIVLITGHRRENFGSGIKNICESIAELSAKFPAYDFVFPVHLNPNVSGPVKEILSGKDNIHLIEPLEYLPFTYLMMKSELIITDSGGIQEEAPSLNKPVLLTRDTSERPEAIASGQIILVGTDKNHIVNEASLFLSKKKRIPNTSTNPYGDGKAAHRIVEFLKTEMIENLKHRNS